MPYPNEHACRLREPGEFQANSFRRSSRKHEGKTYDVIMAKLKGSESMTEQAYRYPKASWTADQARAHCKNHKGSFEAASGKACEECTDTTGDLMKEETVKVKEAYRRFQQSEEFLIERAEGKPRTLTFSASSETPYERWFGTEVLVHEPAAVKLDRAKAGAMPLLFNHNMNDPIGMITKAWLENSRMMVTATLFDTPRADEVMKMIDGGLRNVSVAYRINKIEENTKTDEFRVTDWEPFENSIVTVPADPTVGIGREYEVRMLRAEKTHQASEEEALTRRVAMSEENKDTKVETVEKKKEQTPSEYEARRVKAIENLCRMNRLDEKFQQMFIGQGLSVEDVSEEILKVVEERGKTNPQSIAKLGLSGREAERFSWLRAINACAAQNWHDAPFELECSREVGKRLGKAADPRRFYIPYEVLERPETFIKRSKRDLTVDAGSGGGYLVDTQNMGFIEMLRARAVALRMGARRLSGLVGNITIPRQSAAGTVYWLGTQATATTESQQTFEQVSLSPKTAAAYTEISRQLLLQSNPGAESIVTNDLSAITALGLDSAVLNGAGTGGVPDGIIGFSGVGTVGAGASMSYAGVLECQTDVASAEVMPVAGGYVTTPAIAAIAMQRVKFTSTASPIWEGNLWDGNVAGFPAMSSSQVPSQYMIFGDWAEILIAEWGVLEVEVNPYANFQAGIVGVRCMYSCDVGIKRPGAFSTWASIV